MAKKLDETSSSHFCRQRPYLDVNGIPSRPTEPQRSPTGFQGFPIYATARKPDAGYHSSGSNDDWVFHTNTKQVLKQLIMRQQDNSMGRELAQDGKILGSSLSPAGVPL